MANEFIARRGLKVLSGGLEVTGSSRFSTDVTSSGNIRAIAFYGNGANVTGVISSSYAITSSVATNGIVTASGAGSTITFTKGDGSTFPVTITVGNSATASYVDYVNVANKPTLVSSSTQINTGSFTGSFTGQFIGTSSWAVSSSVATTASYVLPTGLPAGTVSSSGQISYSGLSNIPAGIVSSSAQLTTLLPTGTVSSSLQFNSLTTPFTGSFTGSFSGDGSNITGIATTLNTAGTSGTGTVNLKTQTLTVNGSNGVTTTASGQAITISIPAGTVSSSGQIDVRNTTGIATIATTGSNTFTGVQTINNTTNSTAFNNGALIVQGGVGIARDVNISGSLTVTGLLTAISTSIQYVTSSQVLVGDNRIITNVDDNIRFGGLSVIDSGSSYGTGSLLWDSLNNRWLYEADDEVYKSAVLIGGPRNFGGIGNETGLVAGRVPVAIADNNIDTSVASSSISINFSTLRTTIEAGLTVTGSVSSSVGFWGDGSGLTGIVTSLNLTGSTSGTGTVALRTQGLIVSGTNGITATVNNQTVTISGSNASTTARGVASFNPTNFTVTGGDVTSNNITINGTGVTLGGTRNITLAQITAQGATTADQVSLTGGALIQGVLYASASATIPSPSNSVVTSVATGSYDAAYFDYVLKSGTNLRAGTVISVWQAGTSNIEFTDTSTNDIGDTLGESFTVDLLNGNVRLKLTGDSSTWTVKTAIRMV